MRVILFHRKIFKLLLEIIACVNSTWAQDYWSEVRTLIQQKLFRFSFHVILPKPLAFAKQTRICAHVNELANAVLLTADFIELRCHVFCGLICLPNLDLASLLHSIEIVFL